MSVVSDTPIGRAASEIDLEAILDVVRQRLGMDLAWVSSFTDDTQVFEALAGRASDFGLAPGDSADLEGSFCIRVIDGRLSNIVDDAAANEVTAPLDVRSDLGIGSYIGFPIDVGDSTPVGMLCCVSRSTAPHLVEADVRTLEVFAAVLSELVGQVGQIDGSRRKTERLRAEIESDMGEGRLRMVFQPIVDHATARPIGVEALCRIQDSALRPDEWFEAASAVGIGARAEMAAIAAAVAHLDELPEPLYMSLNASPDTIRDPALVELFGAVDSKRVVLEVTEHHRIDDYPTFVSQLEPFRSLGIKIAVDDVGAGFSSFAHVLELVPDIIKLDRSIVAGIDTDLARQAIAAAVVNVGHRLEATVIAEGIENKDELGAITALGVDAGQGYLFQRPAPIDEALSTLTIPPAELGTPDVSDTAGSN